MIEITKATKVNEMCYVGQSDDHVAMVAPSTDDYLAAKGEMHNAKYDLQHDPDDAGDNSMFHFLSFLFFCL